MNRKVLFISYDGMTDQLGQSQVLPYLCRLSAMGYEFTLLSFEKKEKYKNQSALIESICRKNNIRWIPEFFSKRPPVLSKIYDAWKMKRRVEKLQKEHQFGFTHCRSYVPVAAGLTLFQKHKVPYLFDMRGFWVDERVDNGQWNLKNPFYRIAYNFYKKKEKKYFANSAHIISLTEKGKQELINNYKVEADKISVIPCCADLDHFNYKRIKETDRDELKKNIGIRKGDKILSYLGSLGGWYLTDEMLDFFKQLKQEEPAAKFFFITQDKKEDILDKVVSKNINPSDIIVKPATRQQVPLFLSLSDWSVFFIKDAYSKKASSPTKQGEIMAMGIPIVCNDIGDTGVVINKSNSGVLIPAFNSENYSLAVHSLLMANSEKESIRNAAQQFYSLDEGARRYAGVYNNMTKNIIS